jgi:hypothetical protein
MENLNQMVASVADGNFSAFQQAFEAEMSDRVQDAVNSKYTEMFSQIDTQDLADD